MKMANIKYAQNLWKIWIVFRSYVPMPKLTSDGYRIVIFRIFDPETTNLPTPENIMKATQIGLDISLKLDKFRGMTVIYDLENTSMTFISLLLPMLKKFFALGNVSLYHLFMTIDSVLSVKTIPFSNYSPQKKKI